MIDIVTEKELDLRNVTQIGTPGTEEKIYIANSAYTRIHMDEYREKRVFVLMGHTTCTNGRYTTFVEAAIPVRQIEFDCDTPIWNNRVWSEVFAEIKRSYEDAIIVGWALDIEGVLPEITADLEAIHREHFGGVHQLLYLLECSGGQEYFYRNKNNHLFQSEGFYVYYDSMRTSVQKPKVEIELPRRPAKREAVQRREPAAASGNAKRGVYRDLLLSQNERRKKKKHRHGGNALGVVAVIALLIAIAGAAISKNPKQAQKVSSFFKSVGNQITETFAPQRNDTGDGERIIFSTQQTGKEKEEITDATETAAEVIPIEKVDGKIPEEN